MTAHVLVKLTVLLCALPLLPHLQPRYLHSCADWPHGNSLFCMVCFGGLNASNNILDDMIYFYVNVGHLGLRLLLTRPECKQPSPASSC